MRAWTVHKLKRNDLVLSYAHHARNGTHPFVVYGSAIHRGIGRLGRYSLALFPQFRYRFRNSSTHYRSDGSFQSKDWSLFVRNCDTFWWLDCQGHRFHHVVVVVVVTLLGVCRVRFHRFVESRRESVVVSIKVVVVMAGNLYMEYVGDFHTRIKSECGNSTLGFWPICSKII